MTDTERLESILSVIRKYVFAKGALEAAMAFKELRAIAQTVELPSERKAK